MPAASRPRKPRKPGRPAAGTDLRERVLDAGISCFTARGIGGTPLSAIARSCGVTPALLHYYFGDKDKLVDALVAERLMPVIAEMRAKLAPGGSGATGADADVADGGRAGAAVPGFDSIDLAAAFVNTAFALIERHPWFPQLWVREVLCEGGALRELMVKRIAPQVPHKLERHFRAARRRGELNDGLDPRLLVVSLVGVTLFAAASAPIWRRVFRADDVDNDALRRHALALLDGGLAESRRKR